MVAARVRVCPVPNPIAWLPVALSSGAIYVNGWIVPSLPCPGMWSAIGDG
jgi:hypothetical protein